MGRFMIPTANEAVEKVPDPQIGRILGVRLPLPRTLASNTAHSERSFFSSAY